MRNLQFLIIGISLIITGCATLVSEATGTATPMPTPTPTPEPCTEQAISELVNDARRLAERYRYIREGGQSLLPLLPDLQELRQDVDQLLDLPGCTAKVEEILNRYIDVDLSEMVSLIESTKDETLDEAIEIARRWLDTNVSPDKE